MERSDWVEAFGTFVGALPDALLLASDDAWIVEVNRQCASLLEVSRSQLVGRSLLELSPDPESAADYWRECKTTRAPTPGVLTLAPYPEGGTVTVRVDAGLVVPGARAGNGALIMCRLRPREEGTAPFRLVQDQINQLNEEIRRRRSIERELERRLEAEREAREVAAEASRLKDEFLASLSHELRTPLNILVGWIDILQDQGPNPELVARALVPMKKALDQETELVEDLLDVQRITMAELRLEVESVDLDPLIRDVSRGFAGAMRAKEVMLHLHVAPSLPSIQGDRRRIRQILHNLMSNAVKFTSSGDRISLRATLDPDGERVRITVEDTGEGVPPELVPHVFEPFRQASGYPRETHGGIGAGLAIVKRLVELHGGEVTLESDGRKKGTTVTVLVPVDQEARRGRNGEPEASGDRAPANGGP